ncbi:MAG: asparagine synthase [Clostridium sp.]|nr:asparagine synthase [Clostridium sp.]
MSVKEGIIPTALGTVVTAAGTAMVLKKVTPMVSVGLVGFGLAHIVLGSIDMAQHNGKHKRRMFG